MVTIEQVAEIANQLQLLEVEQTGANDLFLRQSELPPGRAPHGEGIQRRGLTGRRLRLQDGGPQVRYASRGDRI